MSICMKQSVALADLSIALLAGADAAEQPDAPDQQLVALVRDIQGQQTVIAENEDKIEAKLVIVSESIRVARIYSGRGGSRPTTP